MTFADRLTSSIQRTNSFLVAGLDPNIEQLPQIFLEKFSKAKSDQEAVLATLTDFYQTALEALTPHICAIKPNLAFFEQYGLAGLQAFSQVCSLAKNAGLPIIADAKRGDIDSTAAAYARAFLGNGKVAGRNLQNFEVDALTVNPFLGLDTLEPFITSCKQNEKGLFILVRTSNPGSKDIQSAEKQGRSVSMELARFLDGKAQELMGSCGFSSLGAVVGATNANEAQEMRKAMPRNFFLMPGLGTQGGSIQDAVQGFAQNKNGAIINVSRSLLSSFSSQTLSSAEIKAELSGKARDFADKINAALAARS